MHRSDAKLGVLWALVSRRGFFGFLDQRRPTWVEGVPAELKTRGRPRKKLSKVRINVEKTKIESRKDGEAENMSILSECPSSLGAA